LFKFEGLLSSRLEPIVTFLGVFLVGLLAFVEFSALLLILWHLLLLKSISPYKRVEVTVYFVARTLSKWLTFLIEAILLSTLSCLVEFVASLPFELVVVAVVTTAVINHFLAALSVVASVLLELSRRSELIVISSVEFFNFFFICWLSQTLLFIECSLQKLRF
jgi:hypothetical protein